MADGITLDKVNVEIESNSSVAASGIDKLTESINRLKASLNGGLNGLENLNNTIKGISNNFKTSTTGVKTADKSFRSLKSSAKTLTSSFSGIKSETADFGKLVKEQIVNGQTQAKTYERVANGIKQTTKITTNGIKVTKQYVKENKNLSKALNLVKLAATFRVLKAVYNGMKSLVESSTEYISVVNYFNTSMGEMKENANQFVNTMSEKFYLDPKNIMNYMGSFNSLIKGFGIAEDKAYLMSKNLTQLSYDMAAYYKSMGLTIDDAMQKIKSGISGELEPMRAIGIALDQATLQQTAYELGIKKKVSTMTRAQKTELLYYQTMKSTVNAQNYFVTTLAKMNTRLNGSEKLILNPATALSLLKEQFTQLGRAIGNIFIPILTAMIPYIMAATQLLKDLANAIAGFFGFDMSDYDFSKATKSASSGISTIGTEADKTSKKLKGMLAPFDELNTVDFGNGSDAAASATGGSLGIKLPEYDWLENEELKNRVEGLKKSMQTLLPIVAAVVGLFTAWKITVGVANFIDKVRKVGSIFGVGKYTSLLTGSGQIANVTKATASSFQIPSVKTILKGLADLAIIILGTEAIIIAAGAILAIPYFRSFLTSGVNGLIEVFKGLGSVALQLIAVSVGMVLLGSLPISQIALGLASLAIITLGIEGVIIAAGALLAIPNFSSFLETGIDTLIRIFTGLGQIGVQLSLASVGIALLGVIPIGTIGLGLLNLAAIITGIEVVLVAVGALTQIPNFTWLAEKGGEVLIAIAETLGRFIGAIVAGLLGQISTALPEIGTNLSNFMVNAAYFFDNINQIDESATNGVKNLVEALLMLTQQKILSSLTDWFTGGVSLTEFGAELKEFGPYFASYANSVRNVDGSVVLASAEAAKALAELNKLLPSKGGLVQLLTGEKSLAEWGKEVKEFGPYFASYANSVKNVNGAVVTASANAAKSLAELTTLIPNRFGLAQMLTGEQNLAEWGRELATFGPKFASYASSVKNVNATVVTASANAAKSLAELNNIVPHQGGLASLFTGSNKLSDWGADLAKFGDYFKQYYDKVRGVSTATINSVTSSVNSLVQSLINIKNNGLNDTLKDFGKSLSKGADGLSDFFNDTFKNSTAESIGTNFGNKLGEKMKKAIQSKLGTTIKLSSSTGENMGSFSIKAYANGGFPQVGDLFFANENGPEWISTMGGKTAVANQDQMTTGIRQAAYEGVSQALRENPQSHKTDVYIGNEKVYSGYGKYQNTQYNKYGVSEIRV